MPRTPDSLPPITTNADATDELQTLTDVEPHDANATGEIEALDILEVVDVLRASRRAAVPSAQRTAQYPAQSAHVEVPAQSVHPTSATQAGRYPSSIAPFALDLTPSQPPSRASFPSEPSWPPHELTPSPTSPTSPVRDMRESTIQIARAAGIPSRASRIIVFTASIVGMCFVAGVIGVMVGYTRPTPPLTETAPSLAPPIVAASHNTPRVAVVLGAHEEITESPILVAGKDAAAPAETTTIPAPTSTPVQALVSVPAAAPTPSTVHTAPKATARAAPAAAPASSSGIVRVPAGVNGVLVDGAPHRANGGAVAVTCGRHNIKAPGQPSRQVVVPCGGSASF